jgi:hypothetical protein
MDDVGFGAHISIVKGGTLIAQEVIAGIHRFYRYRIGIVVSIQAGIDGRFDRSKKTIFVVGFHFEIKQGRYQKTVQEHQEIQIPEGLA